MRPQIDPIITAKTIEVRERDGEKFYMVGRPDFEPPPKESVEEILKCPCARCGEVLYGLDHQVGTIAFFHYTESGISLLCHGCAAKHCF